MELKNRGQLEDANAEFRELRARFPDYTPQYLHAGNVLAALGRKDEAAQVYRLGIEVASRKNDPHARSEIETALAELGI